MILLNNDWDDFLQAEKCKPYYVNLRQFLVSEYRSKRIYPDMNDIFNALRLTPYADVKVVIIGQDPYINEGEAHGLAFSVKPEARTPPSLRNIFIELKNDLGVQTPSNGCLTQWATQGVMLLNTVLTVEARKSKSHAGKGWETFTSAVINRINDKDTPVVFLLWGRDAAVKGNLITNPIHLKLVAAHPSPLAGGKFFGCKHFSKANEFLINNALPPIDWQL